jgi:transposase
MAGTCEGFTELEWTLLADIFPPEWPKRGRGLPHTPFRHLVNTWLYVLITGCRWCDLPRGPYGPPRVRRIDGCSAGRSRGPSPRCTLDSSGWPRKAG